jgi:hypothetical protein
VNAGCCSACLRRSPPMPRPWAELPPSACVLAKGGVYRKVYIRASNDQPVRSAKPLISYTSGDTVLLPL